MSKFNIWRNGDFVTYQGSTYRVLGVRKQDLWGRTVDVAILEGGGVEVSVIVGPDEAAKLVPAISD
jgi:hypothetical protein